MTVPTAGELIGGFWAGGSYPPAFADTYALAAYLVGRNAAGYGTDAPLYGWTVRADQRVYAAPDGRPAYGYPVPGSADPVWVAYDFIGGAILANGPDFTVDDGYVWFERDPVLFGTLKRHTWVSGSPVASATLLWSPGRPVPPTPDSDGGTYAALVSAVAAACDSPATGTEVETVEAVWLGPDDRYRVVTDTGAYRLPTGDTVGVAAGDVLPPLCPLGTAWRLYRLGVPYPALDRIALPADFFPGSTVAEPVTFPNQSTATIVDTSSGRTRVRWALGGTLADVNAVWTASHAWGTGAGDRTLAEAMDTRTDPTTEPTVADLPPTVNPLEFACRELFAGAGYLLLVDSGKFGPAALTAAERAAAVRIAAGPFAAVVEWDGDQPEPAIQTPS